MPVRPVFVIGAGSVGVFLAARLGTVTKTVLVARDQAVGRFADGVTLVGAMAGHYPIACLGWSAIDRFPPGSLILVTPKIFQLADVLPEIGRRLGPANQLVLFQNGLGVADEAERHLPGTNWGRAIAWFGCRLEAPATIHAAGVHSVEWAGGDPEAMTALASGLDAAGFPAVPRPGIADVEWRKALWNLTSNGLCALAETANGAAVTDALLRPLADTLIDEAVAVAAADGVSLTANDRERVYLGCTVTATNLNSTLQDLWAGRPTEMPWLNAAVVARADHHGLPVPSHRLIANLVGFLESTKARAKAH